jgi:hypothetical protein
MHAGVTLKVAPAASMFGRDAFCIGVFGESGR